MDVRQEWIVRPLRLVLHDARRATGRDQLDAVEHHLDAEREERLIVERAGGVVGPDRRLTLQQDRAGVDASVRPEDRHARAGLPTDELPGDRAPAAVARQQRGMKADGRPAGELEQRLGHDLGDVGEDGQVGIRSRERLPRLRRS